MPRSLELMNKIWCREKYSIIARIFENMEYSIIKGEVLSLLAYNAPNVRQSSDVDILIPKTCLKKVEEALLSNSFETECISRYDEVMLLTSSHQTLPWHKNIYPWGNIILDLNFDIFWGEYEGKRVDMESFISDAIEVDMFGCKVKSLPPLKAMVQLILHNYKDMNSIYLLATRNSIKHTMFRDVYYLLKNNPDTISIEKLYTICEGYEIIPYAYYVLYYTGQVFDDDALARYVNAFRTPEGEVLLQCYGLCAKERKEWTCDFQTRLESNDLFRLIKEGLNEDDKRKIAINKRVFMGVYE